ncbi:tetratricopeptide repeat protein [Streptomyces goshikiensis]|uniref:tetratricopeptide repeat protein n=1 Tax=Streptomyces goshikiensis TaxID=1942 RepID=UPI0036867136
MHANTFHGPTAFLVGDHGTQHVQFVYKWKPAYRIEDFPAEPRPVSTQVLGKHPSRLLRAAHEVVPFTGRLRDLDELTRWRDDPAPGLGVRLVCGPGGQGKTRLATHFAGLSRASGWTVWQAAVNEAGADPVATSGLPAAGAGILLVIDYAERWPVPDLRNLFQDRTLRDAGVPVRVLLLARQSGYWWEGLEHWICDNFDVLAAYQPLPALADDPQARAKLFRQARDSFAGRLGLDPDEAAGIAAPPDLERDPHGEYAQVLTVHIAALAAVDARLMKETAPAAPARASYYLLVRERAHWGELPLSSTPAAMGRMVLTATLTRPLVRHHGQTALKWIRLADSSEAADILLDDHLSCYPPPYDELAQAVTVLEPLYPDRLGEDFIGLITPAGSGPACTPHPLPKLAVDDWTRDAAEHLLVGPDGPGTAAPWTRNALTVLIETARRWPHVATGQLYPLLKKHPELARHGAGSALVVLADFEDLDMAVLEAIEPHLPTVHRADLDIGAAAIALRLAKHQLAGARNSASRAAIHHRLAARQWLAGFHDEACESAETAVTQWRDAVTDDAAHEPGLARSLNNLGICLSGMGRWDEALARTDQAVEIYERWARRSPEDHEPALAAALSNRGVRLSELGRRREALAATEQAVRIRRQLHDRDAAVHGPDLAQSLNNLGEDLWEAGRFGEAVEATEQAVEIYRALSESEALDYEPDLARSLANLGSHIADEGRPAEGLSILRDAVALYRRLSEGNPAVHEPELARTLSRLGYHFAQAGRGEEALASEQDAVEILSKLCAVNPAAHEPELAHSLSTLGDHLSELGRWEEGLDAAERAVEMHRGLPGHNPAHEVPLGAALDVVAKILQHKGELRGALRAVEETEELYRKRVADVPSVRPWLEAFPARRTELVEAIDRQDRRPDA